MHVCHYSLDIHSEPRTLLLIQIQKGLVRKSLKEPLLVEEEMGTYSLLSVQFY
ncbi:hypothetical protein SLEP1_g50861 [Rubroshorea leprosula]|uniref:Uncharacterized protein n=1 Tax=Rubroshorea leprosula TaxID=152421 RepID=A0AAV5M293_9ROSI|nr:hypothetical protein SLEP1_g50861 [Rubroshorea leprosula]